MMGTPLDATEGAEPPSFPALKVVQPLPESDDDLVGAYFAAIYGYLARRVGRDLADDLTAEVFVRALADQARYDPALGTWRMWLFGIATKLVAKHRRAEVRRLTAYARSGASAAAIGANAGPADEVVDRVHAEESLRLLARSLKRLSGPQRDALYLVGVAELSYEEAATALDIPVGTVRSRVSRARAELRKHIERTQWS